MAIVVVALLGCPARTPAVSGDSQSAATSTSTHNQGDPMIVTVRSRADFIEVQKAYGASAYGGSTEPQTLTIRVEGTVVGGALDLDGMGTTPVSIVLEGAQGAHLDGTRVGLSGPSVTVRSLVFDAGARLRIAASDRIELDRVALVATQPAEMPGDAMLAIDATGQGAALDVRDSWLLGAADGAVASMVLRSPTGGGFAKQTLRNFVVAGTGPGASVVHGLVGALEWQGGLVARNGPAYLAEIPTATLSAKGVAGLDDTSSPVGAVLDKALQAARAGKAPDVDALRR